MEIKESRVLDIVVSKKGGSGKTLVALSKLDAALTTSWNAMIIDTNDMNPDASSIILSLLEAMKYILGEHVNIRIPKYPEEVTGDIFFKEVKVTLKLAFGESWDCRLGIMYFEPESPVRGSSLDVWSVIRWGLRRALRAHYNFVIVDTNTSYATLAEGSLKWNNYPFIREILEDEQSFYRALSELMEDIKRASTETVITFIPALDILNKGRLEREFKTLRAFAKTLGEALISLVLNYYNPVGLWPQKPEVGERILSRLKSLLVDEPPAELIQVGRMSLEEIESVIEEVASEGFVTPKEVRRALLKVFSKLALTEVSSGKVISNFTVIPIYDPDLAYYHALLRQAISEEGQLVEMFNSLDEEAKKEVRAVWKRSVAEEGIFAGSMDGLRKLMYYGERDEGIFESGMRLMKETMVELMAFLSRKELKDVLRYLRAINPGASLQEPKVDPLAVVRFKAKALFGAL